MNSDKCSIKQHGSGGLLEASLLSLLREKDSYGYNLMEELSLFTFDEKTLNMSVIYRNLRKMEKKGQITSSWEKSDQGPDKRVYSISDLGLKDLDSWIRHFKERKKIISLLIEKYEDK